MLKISKENSSEAIAAFKYLLKTRQEETSMSCERISKLTGIPHSTVGRIRYSSVKNIKLEHIVKIAKVLDIDLNELKGV
ncbi:helix-turn-helix domain-containing protein [Gemella haemolysans]|uniref:helix-turn-helix domain-containing protein n=1 Tax=Gemella haemolysans TaxID=1379 RepID=UPI0019589D40|nr:helix-turn-helix transcriptional regulator [Gemella haemolysans]